MKPFNKEEYNRMCAEFMGLVEAKPYKTAYTTNNSTNLPASFLELVHSEMEGESWYVYPKFDTDWNWIMEVVDKIESLGYYTNILSADNDSKRHTMHIVEVHKSEEYTEFIDSKKEAVVQAIWVFLNWYNQQQPKKD